MQQLTKRSQQLWNFLKRLESDIKAETIWKGPVSKWLEKKCRVHIYCVISQFDICLHGTSFGNYFLFRIEHGLDVDEFAPLSGNEFPIRQFRLGIYCSQFRS
jgi:hypothetical protein